MAQPLKLARYNDGMVSIYREKERRSNFSAKLNAKTLDDLSFVVKLAYAEQSKRQEDMEFAESMQFSLNMKIKTRFIRGIDNKCKAVIDGYLYDVRYIDTTKTETYYYLEGVCELAAND